MHKVLIIDDHDQIKQMLERRLSKIGYQIFMVSSGEEAKHLLKDQSIDLILLDYLLPEYTGFDFFVEFNKAYNIPIIMMTAHPSLHLAIEFLREGGADFVEKPIDIDVLDIKINRAIANDIRLKEEITARKTAELKLKNTNQELVAKTVILEDLNAELEVFTSSVSHDLKSPLRLINSFSQLLKTKYQNQLDEKGQDYINTIVQSSQKMYVLINDLLNISKTSSQQLNIAPIELSTMMSSVIKDVLTTYPDLQTQVVTDELPIIQGDRTLIYQLFYNLLDNALKYSKKQDISKIHIGATEKNGKILISIRDNGIGFDMQFADKVFNIFVRLHQDDEFTGTGVGLANVKRIINKHSCQICAEREIGKVSTFYVQFPNN